VNILYENDNLMVVRLKDLFAVSFRHQGTVNDLETVAAYQRLHRRTTGKPFCALTVLCADKGRPPQRGVREAAARITDALSNDITAAATVVCGEGLGTAVAYSFLVTFNLLATRPFPAKSFSTINDAVAWLGSYDGSLREPPDASTQLAALLRLERAS
jgi:hypothetical protein